MARDLSLITRQALTAQETDRLWAVRLTIDAEGLEQPIRVINDSTDMGAFVAYPFEIDLPADTDESVARVTIRIDNVDRQIVQALRLVSAPPSVLLEVVRRGTPSAVEAAFQLSLVEARYDALVVEGELAFEDMLNAPFPADQYTPADYPGLF